MISNPGSIRNLERYKQLYEHSKWYGLLPRGITPSDIDVVFDFKLRARMLFCEFTTACTTWDQKRVEAARKYDSQTSERRNYWGELAIWSERRIGELLIESKSVGTIKHGGDKKCTKQGVTLTPCSLIDLLGTETENEAKNISSRSQRLASHTSEAVEQAIEAIKADGEEVSKAAVKRKLVGAHVGHNSGENEWYTQSIHIEAARKVLGCIDLDPASSEIANKTVQATRFYTAKEDGLSKQWNGDVWMNPPYSSDLIGKFCEKLVLHVGDGSVTSAIVLINNATETNWFHTLASKATAYCFPKGRVRFVDINGELGAPLQGQCFVYFGDATNSFNNQFKSFGLVVKSY